MTDFFHSFVNGSSECIECKVVNPASGALEYQIRIALSVSVEKRLLFTALCAGDGYMVHVHLTAFGFLPKKPGEEAKPKPKADLTLPGGLRHWRMLRDRCPLASKPELQLTG